MKTDQTAWIVLSVGLNCYEDSDQTAWIVLSL